MPMIELVDKIERTVSGSLGISYKRSSRIGESFLLSKIRLAWVLVLSLSNDFNEALQGRACRCKSDFFDMAVTTRENSYNYFPGWLQLFLRNIYYR